MTMLMSSACVLIERTFTEARGSACSGPETCHSQVRGLSSIIGLKDNIRLTMATSLFLRVEEWWTVRSSHTGLVVKVLMGIISCFPSLMCLEIRAASEGNVFRCEVVHWGSSCGLYCLPICSKSSSEASTT